MKLDGCGVLLVAHGSIKNPGSSQPTRQLVHQLRERDAGREVRCAFWREQPTLREALGTLDATDVICVPVFISDGWFTGTVLPRELGLSGPLTIRDDRRVAYTAPVGTHIAMTNVLRSRCVAAMEDLQLVPGQVTVIVAGHGTPRSKTSAKAIEDQVTRLSGTGFAHVQSAFLDDEPFVGNAVGNAPTEHVVVVPFFISDGFHTRQDIPEAIGVIAEGPISRGEHEGKRVLYTSAVGTDEVLVEVVMARLEEGLALLDSSRSHLPDTELTRGRAFWAALDDRAVSVGPVSIEREGERWRIHTTGATPGGAPPAQLTRDVSLAALDVVLTRNPSGDYRPVRWHADIPLGWSVSGAGQPALLDAVETVFPGITGAQLLQPWAEAVSRFEGRQDRLQHASRATVEQAAERVCSGCLRHPAWLREDEGNQWIRCPEPCPLLLEEVLTSEGG